MKKIGIPKSLLYYYYNDLWKNFFKKLGITTIYSTNTNKLMIEKGEKLANDEACLSLKIYLAHVNDLLNKCDYILVPRIYSLKKNEGVCTNFNCLYDLVNNTFKNINIINYNVDITSNKTELLAFLNMGRDLEFSYIESYIAYKYAKKKELEERKKRELIQKEKLNNNNIKILIAAHPYNIFDSFIGNNIINYLEENKITILFSNSIDHNIIDYECRKISTDIHWTHNKEIMASMNFYKDKVDGIIIISSFPCGPDSLANALAVEKIKNIPIITLTMDNLNSDVGIMTRLESFIDILKQKEVDIYE